MLLNFYSQNPKFIVPEYQYSLVKSMVNSGTRDLADISISRLSRKSPWGITVPGDPNHTIYVWLDALINYYTTIGYPKESACNGLHHIIGKDILFFHGVLWPALLLAHGYEL